MFISSGEIMALVLSGMFQDFGTVGSERCPRGSTRKTLISCHHQVAQ